MIRHRRLSRHLLEDSEDALRRVSRLLDDAPGLTVHGASAFDLHMALGMLDRVYELECAADAPAGGAADRPRLQGDSLVGDPPERPGP